MHVEDAYNGRMVSIRTERLLIIIVPTAEKIPDFEARGATKRFISEHLRLEPQESANVDITDIQCLCFLEVEARNIGSVCSTWDPETGLSQIGFGIHKDFSGKGYGSEATMAVVQWLLSRSEVNGILGETFTDFLPSIRIMEKAGLKRVNTDLGPYMLRYALTKDGCTIDLTEGTVITLEPFSYPFIQSAVYLLKTEWRHSRYFYILAAIVVIGLSQSEPVWIGIGMSGVAVYCLGWMVLTIRQSHKTYGDTYLQFRQSGLFFAHRSGNGGLTPWKVFSQIQLPKRGGLELWNGQRWYWIPPAAFSNCSVADATAFLKTKGIS